MSSLRSGILLAPDHWEQMQADVSSKSLEEACGLVLGKGNRSALVIPVTNVLHDAYRFRMDALEELNAFQLAEEKELDVIAVYHSHPRGIQNPSPTDIGELTFPGIIYLIWYEHEHIWRCRGYLMGSQENPIEVPVIISTNE